jgi:hypothetical protein
LGEAFPIRWDCAKVGHCWTDSRRGLTPLRCLYCQAIGVMCPDCRGWVRSTTDGQPACDRCKDHGVIEVCVVTLADLAYLTLTAHRFKFLVKAYADSRDGDAADAVREIDVLMAAAGLGE